MSAPGDLVVEPENEDAEPIGSLEGAGVVASVADAYSSIADGGDVGDIALDVGGAAIDALGTVADPFGSLASAGVGWLIEHVWFLHEPLDALAGDPTRITAQARTWNTLSGELGMVAAEHRDGLATVGGWEGAAGSGYRVEAGSWTGELAGAGRESSRLAAQILDSAALVATVRATIRDMIADFLGGLIGPAVAALAAAAFTAGGSVLAWVAAVVAKAVSLAKKFISMIEKLLEWLGVAAGAVERCVRRLTDLADRAAERGRGMQARAADPGGPGNPLGVPDGVVRAAEAVDGSRLPVALEAAGRESDATEERETWG